ncbi:MAG TPA: outer membrane lipid asymmetry maintenance protein MlaD [Rhizomicrobium sp.]|jgi:phospholipid/cholesterol/gamma-HCH transport system substrate-binding protein|nr:outer membrane lipid asymmetry maintenance protein MlaD [Rhizomicrobium sp.]
MQNNTVETLIGAIVVAVAAGFLFFAYTTTHSGSINGYDVKATFSSADGIATGADVRLHGIKIGTVSSIDLDPKTYNAVVHLSIRDDVKVPDDSSVRVISSLLGGNSYLSIQPGGSDKMLMAGGVITNTQGSIDLMGLIGRVIYGNSGSK